MLSVRELRKSYGGVRAVDRVSFEVAAGEMVALIGPNGAGKSTCFNAMNGQVRPDAGSIELGGVQIGGIGPEAAWRLGVGRTFQITAAFASMTVRENVQMVLLSHAQRAASPFRRAAPEFRDEACRLLSLVGMENQADRPCGVLAYGDLKRLELAMALGNGPRLLLMDEPTAGMAPAERVGLMRLVRGLVTSSGLSVLFTEHDMDVVFGTADRIIVLNRGAVIATGVPEAIRSDPGVREVYLGGGTTFSDGVA